jgi:hypothetical protein
MKEHSEEVDGSDFPDVIPQECLCLPTLRWRSLDGLQDTRDGSFGNLNSELE